MPYLIGSDHPEAPAGARFRAALARPGILRLPGAHNGMAALQAKAAGFEALYLSGAAMSASMGLPDLGILTVDEVAFFIRQITRASGLPLLVDGDTGYGEALNVMHMVRVFEEAGAAAVHLEDQLLPKKCGHLNDKKLASPAEMAAKVAAAVRARRHLVVIARTDAAAAEGIEGAVARAQLYVEAGADAIFPEALTSVELFRAFRARLPGVKLLANMTEFGRTPALTAAEDKVDDPILNGFAEAGKDGQPMPAIAAMGAVWKFWGAAQLSIIDGKAEPAVAWQAMVKNINDAIAAA